MKQKLHKLGISAMVLSMLTTGVGFASDVHIVSKGDTLWSIARKHKSSVSEIEKANGINSNKPLKLGAKLTIPGKDNSPKKEAVKKRSERLAKNFRTAALRTTSTQPTSNTGSNSSAIIKTALSYRGVRYVRGGTSRSGFDCSGFTRHVYLKYGVNLPHSSRAQASCGQPVSRGELKAGDLVFFNTRGGGISHVGLFIGKGQFIHAATTGRGVVVSALSEAYYSSRYVGARRIKKS